MIRKHIQFALVFGTTLVAALAVASVAYAETAPTPTVPNPVAAVLSTIWGGISSIVGAVLGSLGWIVVQATGYLMVMASSLFSLLIEHIIIDFSGTLNALGITGGINTVWTAFRDFGNILIIGMFTFIAIGTILGTEQYGAKKMIARVLIVAILINFSLLFTKLAIDASNFVAYQFYKSAAFASVATTGAGAGASVTAVQNSGGIGSLFLTKTGVSSTLQNLGAMAGAGFSQGISFIFVYTLSISALFLILAGIFLYGSLLIITRAFVLVLLMITSAIALASSLVPAMSHGKFSWKAWLDMLLKTSIFAPVLMILLWGSLIILSQAPASSVSLADYLKDPTNPNAWTIIFMYFFTAGMLFASIKVASSLSSGLPGLGIAGIASMLPFAFGARLLGGLGRQTVGRVGSKLAGGFKAASEVEKSPDWVRRLADAGAVGTRKATQRDFNLMRTSVGANLLGVAGAKKIDLLTGKALKGFEGAQKASAERLVEQAKRMTPSKEEQKEVRENALKEALAADPAGVGARHAAASKDQENAKQMIDLAKKQQAELTEKLTDAVRDLEQKVHEEFAAETRGDVGAKARREAAEEKLQIEREKHMSAINEQAERIKQANKRIAESDVVKKGIEQLLEKDGKIPKITDTTAAKEEVIHNRFSNILGRAIAKATDGKHGTTKENDAVLKIAKKLMKEKGKADKLKDTGLVDAIKGLTKDDKDHAPKEKPADDHKEDDHH